MPNPPMSAADFRDIWERSGMTQKAFADAIGLSVKSVECKVKGTRSVTNRDLWAMKKTFPKLLTNPTE